MHERGGNPPEHEVTRKRRRDKERGLGVKDMKEMGGFGQENGAP